MDSDPEYTTFIENIVKTHNNIKIMESQNDPMIQKWANKYGFSILELAMIQPTYEFMDKCRLSNTQYCTLRESYELLGKVYENRYSQEITRQNWVDVFQRI